MYSKIAMTVKKAKECGILLDQEFYQEALVQLRQWGQDQDALSAVYKAMRKLEQFGGSTASEQERLNSCMEVEPCAEDDTNSSVHGISSESSLELSQPESHRLMVSPPVDAPMTPSTSLEGMLQKTTQNQASLLQLLEVHM